MEPVAPTLHRLLEGYGNPALANLKAELTLSDLNYSNQKRNEITSALGEEKSDKTYIVCDSEVRRKSPKMTKNTESKENMNTSLVVSGVRPLSFKPFVSTPLMEKNLNNAERLSWSHSDATEPKPKSKVRISLDPVFSSEEKREILKRGAFEKRDEDVKNLMKVSSLESLKTQNMSCFVPESNDLTVDKECHFKVNSSTMTLAEVCLYDYSKFGGLPKRNYQRRAGILKMSPETAENFPFKGLKMLIISNLKQRGVQALFLFPLSGNSRHYFLAIFRNEITTILIPSTSEWSE